MTAESRPYHIALLAPSGRLINYWWSEEAKDSHGIWVKVQWEGQAYDVEVRVALSRDTDDVEATGLLLGPRDGKPGAATVTTRSLRALPLNDILFGLERLPEARGWLRKGTSGRQTVAESLGLLAPTRYRAARVHPGPKGWPREHFEAIAKAYNEIRERNPHSPMQELADQQRKSLPQVRRWVLEAERKGFRVNRPEAVRITRLKSLLVFKGRGENWGLDLLAREKGYTPPAESTLFNAPPRLIDHLIGELEKLPDIDLPVHIDPNTGEVVEGPESAPSEDEPKERS